MNFNSPFGNKITNDVKIDSSTKVVFVADAFVEHYVGGAELTTDALIQYCKFPYQKLLAKDVTIKNLAQGYQALWVFGNFATMDMGLIPSIVANMRYVVLEYDYKYCKYRSPEKHAFAENSACDCHQQSHGKMISAFYLGAKWLFWMSEQQMKRYFEIFPFLQDVQLSAEHRVPGNTILSSVFDDSFFVTIKALREKNKNVEKNKWIVLGSSSWIKNAAGAEQWCKDNNKEYEIVWNVPYNEILEKLSCAKGLVYLPLGADTCPRLVIEAKLLGCDLVLNENVQHRNEEWFVTDDLTNIEEYLYGARTLFWNYVMPHIDYTPTISGYTTTRNCIEQKYPWKECIKSMLDFCDEVVVVDGGSTDGTWEELQKWAEADVKVKVHLVKRDWSSKRFAVFDGAQKAEARRLCTKEFCWQMDADEVVRENSKEKIHQICKTWPQLAELVSLPVVEFWGSVEKIRIDVNPWKWRLSKNLPHITHGIPIELRKTDENGEMFAALGTDGCDYVHSETGQRIPHVSFYNEGAHNARFAALNGNTDALKAYEKWMQQCVDILPTVNHFSWIDIARKIRTYKNYWSLHWQSLHNIQQNDTPENNMFFDKKWADVTDEEIDARAKQLAECTGGHIFHTKFDATQLTPSINVK